MPPARGIITSSWPLVTASPEAEPSVNPVILLLPIAIAPDIVPPARGSLVAIEFVTVVLKAESSESAAASSLRVSKEAGAPPTRLLICVSTHPFVAADVLAVGSAMSVNSAVKIYTTVDY